MVIAVVAVRMMQPALDEIVGVVAVRYRIVPTAGAMDMTSLVAFVPKLRRTATRVLVGHFDHMLVDGVTILMVQMAVMQVIDMVAVLQRDVTAGRAVMMGVFGMCEMARHEVFLPSIEAWAQWISQACAMALSTRFRTCASAIA